MKRLSRIMMSVVLVAGIAGIAYAQFSKPADAIKYRKAAMFLIGQHFGPMGAIVKGKQAYDQKEFLRHALLVQSLSTMTWDAFLVPGSDTGDTRLKPSALSNQAGFMKAAQDFEDQAKKLVEAAQGGELQAIRGRFGSTAQTCGGCHKPFRS